MPLLSRLAFIENELQTCNKPSTAGVKTLEHTAGAKTLLTYSMLSPKKVSTAFRLSQCFSVWLQLKLEFPPGPNYIVLQGRKEPEL